MQVRGNDGMQVRGNDVVQVSVGVFGLAAGTDGNRPRPRHPHTHPQRPAVLNAPSPQMPSERLQTAFFTQFPPFPILLDTL
ncbi:hypothetical protein [Neisseria meningitidis]|uniref:hypothetical protein n=1 Tax=Neisseria meningitidis TaxID=487 RepID=UPI000ADA70E0|nr:hypothetical protein [Neisseria meningitidis]